MAKDSLARGARSATFMGGTPDKDAPIELAAGIVAETCEHGKSVEETCVLCEKQKQELAELIVKPEPKTLEELAALYEPMNDRVLLRRVTDENRKSVQLADAFKLDSDVGIVIATGAGMLVNGQLVPIPLVLGDKVRFGHYNAEDVEIEGETLVLVSAYDVRLKLKT